MTPFTVSQAELVSTLSIKTLAGRGAADVTAPTQTR